MSASSSARERYWVVGMSDFLLGIASTRWAMPIDPGSVAAT